MLNRRCRLWMNCVIIILAKLCNQRQFFYHDVELNNQDLFHFTFTSSMMGYNDLPRYSTVDQRPICSWRGCGRIPYRCCQRARYDPHGVCSRTQSWELIVGDVFNVNRDNSVHHTSCTCFHTFTTPEPPG